MRARRYNHALVRRYLGEFERRFMRTGDGVVYARPGAASGVLVPDAEAASLIAGMRASLSEADAASGPAMGSVWPWLIATPMLLMIAGAVTDYMNAATALIAPVWLLIMVAGPVMAFVRITFAFRRGLAAADAALADCAPAEPGTVPVNAVRPVFGVVATIAAAVIAGLFIASETSPEHARVAIDRLLGGLIWPLALIVIAFGLATAFVDARMRRVSEAEIAEARAARGNRPLG